MGGGGGFFGYELPSNLLRCAELRDCVLSFLTLQKLCQQLELFVSMDEVVPWSLHRSSGLPRRAIKRLRVERKASVVRSETNSRCAAFTVSETKMQI